MDIVLLVKALILGVVEGLTEFLPISSTGHLILAGALLDFNDGKGKIFEVVIQCGAILAVCWEYRRRIIGVACGIATEKTAQRFVINLFIAFLPLALLGLAFQKQIKAVLFAPVPVAVAFIVGGLIILLIEGKHREGHFKPRVQEVDELGWRDAVKLGFAQALALIPGMSRSGSTISLALNLRWLRPEALKLSFLMGLIAIGGAGLIEAKEISNIEPGPGFAGFASSLLFSLVGLNAIKLIVAKAKLRWFACYCAIAGLAALIWLALR